VEDSRPRIESRFQQLFTENLEMISSSSHSATPILPFKPLVATKKKTKRHLLVERIAKKLESYASPYESYLVDVASQREDEPPEKRKKLVHSTIKTD